MPSESEPAQQSLRHLHHPCQNDHVSRPRWIRRWTSVCTVVSGASALFWLVLRSGTRPSRLAYPCQQAAIGTAAAAFGVPFIASIIALRGRLFAVLRAGSGKVAVAGLAVLCAVWVTVAAADRVPNITISTPPPGYEPDVFLVNDARGVEPGRYGGVDDLVALMGKSGLKLHRTTALGPTWGPDGLIDADDVVLLKVNAQWPQRGGTNTDVLRGVIRRIVEHPDGFVGEVIVVDNGQGLGDLDRAENNAEDHGQSAQDVVNDFAAEGWQVSTKRWDTMRSASVAEYDVGDYADGYVVNPTKDPTTRIYVSYPKFRSSHGTYISYKYGVWSPSPGIFEPDRLVVINIPVFKTHGSYAITASVKHYMGVVTTALGTGAHTSVLYGGMGSVLSEVRMPDLNVLDCIWILARPGAGPSAGYDSATRRDQLVASTDPVALDVWATKYIMIPQIIDNGYDDADYQDWQDPDNPNSRFRTYLDRSMTAMLGAGIDTTNDYNSVRLHIWAEAIPTVSAWGAIILGLSVLTAGSLVIPKRRMPRLPRNRGACRLEACGTNNLALYC